MTQPAPSLTTSLTTSRILRAPPGTRGGLADLGDTRANPHAKKPKPLETGISLVAFGGALLTLGFFAIANWSGGSAPQPEPTRQPAHIAQASQVGPEAAIAQAISPSALGSFYKGDHADPDNPIAMYHGPVLSEDGSGRRAMPNAYGAPTSSLFRAEAGGWGAGSSYAAQSDLH